MVNYKHLEPSSRKSSREVDGSGDRLEAPDHLHAISLKIGEEPSKIVLSPLIEHTHKIEGTELRIIVKRRGRLQSSLS
ncbi:hypothetical protein TNCV_3603341 [Trichonephila clavipes]|nr:hypothetical protein TNCV_3603341 [Trichonephila clavipes]